MLVRHFMTQAVLSLDEGERCRAALDFLREHRIRRAPVLRKGKLVGIVSERDLLRVLPGTIAQIDSRAGVESEKLPVFRVMTSKLITLDPEEHLEDASRKMLTHRIGGLPVVHGGALVGILTESDIFRAFARMFDADGVLRVSVSRAHDSGPPLDLAGLAVSVGAQVCGLISHERPGGEDLTVLRLRGGDRPRLLAALGAAGCQVLELVDRRPAHGGAAAA